MEVAQKWRNVKTPMDGRRASITHLHTKQKSVNILIVKKKIAPFIMMMRSLAFSKIEEHSFNSKIQPL